ncbi:hypothetical protein [Alteromonas antoniana]|uniref:hypothetical protein n=1 Tax=Alteromonas antoniana TaxID=2803813 RepID=UPI001C4978F0|nr:hypothetical protein [Alteromonas antoniana]
MDASEKYIECLYHKNCGGFATGNSDLCEDCHEEQRELQELNKPTVRNKEYFNGAEFDCSKEHLLNELATRAEQWFKQTDGAYAIPRVGGQLEQILEMAIAAKLKSN